MDENENKQNEQDIIDVAGKKIADKGKDFVRQQARNLGKKAAKVGAKLGVKVVAAIIPHIVPIIVGVLVVVLVSGLFYAVQDGLRDAWSTVSTSIKSVLVLGENGNPQIPSKKELLQIIDNELDNLGIKKDSLSLGNEDQANAYLYKFMIASLSTQVPYIEDSTAEPITSVLAELDKAQEVQGIVKIKRQSPDANSPKDLKYIKYGKSSTGENGEEVQQSNEKTFSKLVNENSNEALNYFSIDENWMLCVAKYQQVTVTGSNESSSYTIEEVKIPYQTILQNYSIPFSFFITLQQMTENAEYVSAVADMILNQGEIEITLYDTIETITSEYTYTYDLNTKKWIEIESTNLPTQGDDTQGTGTGNTTGNGTGSNTGGNNQGGSTKPNKPNSGGGMIPMERSAVKRIAISTSPITNTTGGNTTGGSSTTQLPDILNNGQLGEGTTTQPTVTRMLQTDKQEGIKETATTTTITNTITANITKANVWVIAHSATYEKDNPPIEYPLGEEGITTECDPKNEPEPEEEGEWKTNRVETTKETNIKKGWKLANSNTSIEPDIFLGLWKNGFGKYVEGAVYTPNGKVVKYTLPGSVKKTLNEDDTETLEGNVQETPVRVLLSAEDMFYTLLENREDTQMHAQIMRELIAYYKADGDYEINVDLSIFDTSEFTGVALYGSSTAKDFIHYFEGTPKQTADGSQYVVFDDGYGNLTVGWGIYIKSHKARFAVRGINADTLKVGSTVDKQIVDSIEDEIIEEFREYVIQIVGGLGLEEYQIDALTSRVFNCGTSGGMSGFVAKYEQYGNTEALYTNLLSKPVTSGGKYSAGLEKRRKAEWDLFHTGYYINTGSYYSAGSASSSSIIDKAKQCHDFLRTNGFVYAQTGQNVPVTTSSKKTIDCSSYVSWVLYEAGFKEFAGYQKTSSYFASNPMNWEKVTKGNLQPGDIMVFKNSGHVQIYAGNGQYYNCGSNDSIKTQAPSGRGRTENDSGFLFGLRPNQ